MSFIDYSAALPAIHFGSTMSNGTVLEQNMNVLYRQYLHDKAGVNLNCGKFCMILYPKSKSIVSALVVGKTNNTVFRDVTMA